MTIVVHKVEGQERKYKRQQYQPLASVSMRS